MSGLVALRDGHARASSLVVAEKFGKQHKHVMRAVRGLLDACSDLEPNFGLMVQQVAIGSGAQRNSHYYEMDRKGFTLLAMGFTGPRALEWKIAYIDAFDRMEAMLTAQANDGAADLPGDGAESPILAQMRGEDFDRKLSLMREIRQVYGRAEARRMWNGIGLPPVVEDEDAPAAELSPDLAAWMNERTQRAPGHRIYVAALYDDYRRWMLADGAAPRELGSFGKALARAGYPSRKSNRTYREGLRLRD